MNEYLIKYAFTEEELKRHAGLFSWLAKTTLGKMVKLIAAAVKKLVLWVMATYGITTASDLYTKLREDPTELFRSQEWQWRVWRTEEGFFENALRIGSYLFATFGLSGVVVLVIDKFLSKNYGKGFEDFGRWLDERFNTGVGGNLNIDPSKLNFEEVIGNLITTNSFVVSMKDLKTIYGVEENSNGKIIRR